jgi:hypothetical protein
MRRIDKRVKCGRAARSSEASLHRLHCKALDAEKSLPFEAQAAHFIGHDILQSTSIKYMR